MRQKSGPYEAAEKNVKDVRRKTRRKFSAEDKIRTVPERLRGGENIAEGDRPEPLSQLVKGILGGWQEAASRRYHPSSNQHGVEGSLGGVDRPEGGGGRSDAGEPVAIANSRALEGRASPSLILCADRTLQLSLDSCNQRSRDLVTQK